MLFSKRSLLSSLKILIDAQNVDEKSKYEELNIASKLVETEEKYVNPQLDLR
jgi:hypothetical protein